MLVVGLFNGLASWLAYVVIGVPHAGLWAAITGLVSIVPFLGYLAVAALTLQLTMTGATAPALFTLALGFLILLCGDKLVRPLVARNGVRLRFVWILIGCLGGFEVFGLVGVVVGPVVLTLARELGSRARAILRSMQRLTIRGSRGQRSNCSSRAKQRYFTLAR